MHPNVRSGRTTQAWLMVLTLVAATSAQAADPATPPAPTDPTPYVIGGGLENVQLSPDGTRMAGMVRTASGLRALVSRKVDGSDQRVAYHLKEPGMDLSLVRWLGNERFLLRVSNNQELINGTMPYPITRLVSIGVNGDKPQVLSKPGSRGWVNHMSTEATPACPAAPLVQVQTEGDSDSTAKLDRYDAQAMRWLSSTQIPAGSRGLFTDAQGEVRLIVRTQGERLVRQEGSLLGRWKPWAPRALNDTDVERTRELGIGADGSLAYLMVKLKSGKSEVWRLPLDQDDAKPETLVAVPDDLARPELLINTQTCEPVGLLSQGQLWTWADGLDRLVAGIRAQLPDRDVELLAWQGDRYLARIGSATAPTEYLIGTRSSQRLQGLGSTHASLPVDLELVEKRVDLPNGTSAKVLLRAPAQGPRPTILCIDCMLDLDDRQGRFDALKAYWARQGWAVVSAPTLVKQPQDSLRRTADYLRYYREALDTLMAQGVTQRGRVAVVAMSSEAGRVALLLGAEPGRVQAVATLGALTDVPAYAGQANDRDLGAGFRAFVGRLIAGMDSAALREVSPVHRSTDQQAAVLLIHADHDATLPSHHAQAMHRALMDHKRPSTLLILKDSTEQVDHPPYRVEVVRAIDKLFAPVLTPSPEQQVAR